MTPEEVQKTMDFILSSHANSVVRMDRLESNLDRLESNLMHLESDFSLMREDQRLLRENLNIQRESLRVLAKMTHDLVRVSRSQLARSKRLEDRADGVDEMIRVIRELIENNLRRPSNPS